VMSVEAGDEQLTDLAAERGRRHASQILSSKRIRRFLV
jgi:hypothetical protein